jgi:pimeloyl-ACP methyl ester carboxylesterase
VLQRRNIVGGMQDVVFLPGIVAPVSVRYGPLLERLPGVNAILKDLEVYATEEPPARYSVQTEIDGIEAAADNAGLERFHLYGHSGGAACALAYVAAHPDRVLSLTVDEPASDFSQADREDPYWQDIDAATALTGPEAVRAFLALQVAPNVDLPDPPKETPPWMSKRPAGMRVFASALRRHTVSPAHMAAFDRPVLFTFGSLTHPRWIRMRDRLERVFPTFSSEKFDGLHHLNTSHQAEPDRTARLLAEFWRHADSSRCLNRA